MLFLWNGLVAQDLLKNIIAKEGWNIPQDLFEFWCQTGGGDIFETEEILCPTVNLNEIKEVNLAIRSVTPDLIAFHMGLCITAVRQSNCDYVVLESEGGPIINTYKSFESWYKGTLRAEYSERYGLV